jgi:hypothetical protein
MRTAESRSNQSAMMRTRYSVIDTMFSFTSIVGKKKDTKIMRVSLSLLIKIITLGKNTITQYTYEGATWFHPGSHYGRSGSGHGRSFWWSEE